MQRDPQLVLRILKEIESWTGVRARRLELPGVDRQILLDHLVMLSQDDEGLIRTTKPHRSSRTGLVDQVLVYALTAKGREALNPAPYEPQWVEFAAGGNGTKADKVSAREISVDAGSYRLGPETVVTTPVDYRAEAVEFGPDGIKPFPGEVRLSMEATAEVHSAGGRRLRAMIVLDAEALLLITRAEIAKLREERRNDTSELRQLEELEQQAENVRKVHADAEIGKATPQTVQTTRQAFGDFVRRWLAKDETLELATNTCKMGLFVLATSLCWKMGVTPDLAAGISGAIVGGKNVVDVVKAIRGPEDKPAQRKKTASSTKRPDKPKR